MEARSVLALSASASDGGQGRSARRWRWGSRSPIRTGTASSTSRTSNRSSQNQAQGDQQRALAGAVAAYATLLVTEGGPDPQEVLGRIAHKHASLGITEDQYPIVHEHLFAAIVEILGDAVTPEVAGAWDEVYCHMAQP